MGKHGTTVSVQPPPKKQAAPLDAETTNMPKIGNLETIVEEITNINGCKIINNGPKMVSKKYFGA